MKQARRVVKKGIIPALNQGFGVEPRNFLENDVTGCYDRMVNNLMLLELHHLGLPMAAAHTLGLP
jgi:hypothetical protein